VEIDSDSEAIIGPSADNVILFERSNFARDSRGNDGNSRDDDELLRYAKEAIANWKAESGIPSLTQVQELFYKSISAGASAMARDKIIDAVIAAFGQELGGRRALGSTWNRLAKEFAAECAQAARDERVDATHAPLTPAQKAKLREALWPSVSELAQAPDLMDRVVRQVQAMGVVNERDLIVLTYVAGTSRVLQQPVNLLAKGTSGSGKSFTTTRTLKLIGPDFVDFLTSASALSLVYDDRPLSHKVLVIYEANQLQADENSTFAMLVRTLMSEGRIVHQTTVEDPDSSTGRRVERIVRDGPIALVVTTTGDLHSENETRMLSWYVGESHEQTAAVMAGLAARAAGVDVAPVELAVWHDLQHWIALGPNDAVIPFAQQIVAGIKPLMVRFRRDVGSLFNFIKASALLHQAQRQVDAKGRVIATIADYALAYPMMAQSSGKAVPDNVRAVVKLIAERAGSAGTKPANGKFQRIAASGPGSEVVISSEQIGAATGIGKSSAYRAILAAIDLGFLTNNETRRGRSFRLVLKHDVDDVGPSLLPDPITITQESGAA
jgi:hypothetical protein